MGNISDREKRKLSDLKFSILMHFIGENETCRSKASYPDKKTAMHAVTGGHLVAYRCLFCGKWHVSARPHRDRYDDYEQSYVPSRIYTGDQFYEEGCFGKAAFSSRLSAAAHALYRRNQHVIQGNLDIYPCRHCHKWHIGHSAERDILQSITA